MTAEPIALSGWRGPGCGETCGGPVEHDPTCHETHGFRLALEALRPRIVRTGPLLVDLDARTATVCGRRVHLSEREWSLLAYLAERIDRTCPLDDILRDVWGSEWVTGHWVTSERDRRRRVDHQHMRTVASRLRTKLGQAGALLTSPYRGSRQGCSGLRLERLEPTS